jgi:hypothetical protein
MYSLKLRCSGRRFLSAHRQVTHGGLQAHACRPPAARALGMLYSTQSEFWAHAPVKYVVRFAPPFTDQPPFSSACSRKNGKALCVSKVSLTCGSLGGAGGTRTHDPGIMRAMAMPALVRQPRAGGRSGRGLHDRLVGGLGWKPLMTPWMSSGPSGRGGDNEPRDLSCDVPFATADDLSAGLALREASPHVVLRGHLKWADCRLCPSRFLARCALSSVMRLARLSIEAMWIMASELAVRVS